MAMVMSATFEERFKTMHRLEGEPEQTIGELELERIKWPKMMTEIGGALHDLPPASFCV